VRRRRSRDLGKSREAFVAILGGAKVGDKLAIAKVLCEKADTVIVGGGMAYTFEASLGRSIGSSLFDPSTSSSARNSCRSATS